jgi:hypothetical protein
MFDVLFTLHNHSQYKGDIPHIEIEEDGNYKHIKGTAKFDLYLAAIDVGKNFYFAFEYCTKLFKGETMERFIKYFMEILDSILKNQDITLDDIIVSHDRLQVDSYNIENEEGDFKF